MHNDANSLHFRELAATFPGGQLKTKNVRILPQNFFMETPLPEGYFQTVAGRK